MARRIGFGVLFAIIGYVVFAFGSDLLIDTFSSNTHDRSLEAAMTSAFVFGPLGAIVGFIGGCVFGGRRTPAPVEK